MTTFWWVNQNNSFDHDRPLGILWAPLRTEKGYRQRHWDALDDVAVGDVIFHYAGQHIKSVGYVSRGSLPTAIPYKGGDVWQNDGRSIQVIYSMLEKPLPLTEIPTSLRVEAKTYGSAFDKNGDVNQGYLFSLPSEVGVWLSDRLDLIPDAVDDEEEQPEDQKATAYFDETNRRVVVNARREQSTLRDFLFKDKTFSTCSICGRQLPVQLLTTAHIKPRKHCDTVERNDPYVVMAACTLGCDALFEKHFIIVDANGAIQSGWREGTHDLTLAVEAVIGRACEAFSPRTSAYFESHRLLNSEFVGASV
ncbi:hypothetical protein [Arthrobacter sp. SLBN-122]|uniref:hypothetical protein n=1 Tax=Arthrobacter sp. SLBN-122 TaxID=2768455 RepID=UPI0011537DB9|nr:hypothetical protein [Arthrobacter sp. SLBN-122]TQJ33048.1 hypothetical protein FBY36_0252 [Arthrobacter sp. SLBN-122]